MLHRYLRDAISIARRALGKLFMFLRSAFLRSLCQLHCISNAPFGFWESIDKPSLQQNDKVFDCDIYANILCHLQCHSEFVKNSYPTKWQGMDRGAFLRCNHPFLDISNYSYYINWFPLKVRKSQKQFFLPSNLPKSQRNIFHDSSPSFLWY